VIFALSEGAYREHRKFQLILDKKKTRVALAAFLTEGSALMARCANESQPSPDSDAEKWAQKVETFLFEEFDPSYIARFRDGSNYQ
jgi:hypothetical protein